MGKVISKDGTSIAFDQSGEGPAVILVASALADRSDAARLAKVLAGNFTVINNGAKALTDVLPHAQYRSLEGQNHGAVMMAPKAVADVLVEFFSG